MGFSLHILVSGLPWTENEEVIRYFASSDAWYFTQFDKWLCGVPLASLNRLDLGNKVT